MTTAQCVTLKPGIPLPFYSTKDSLHSLVRKWGDDNTDVSIVSYEQERHFWQYIHHQCPPVILVGVDRSLLRKRVIAQANKTETRPVIVALIESADEALLTDCYKQGADRVIVMPFCSSRIFAALLLKLLNHNDDYAPYLIDPSIQSFKFGESQVRLTKRPFDLAQYLFLNHGRMVPKTTILQDVWGLDSDQCTTRRIEAHMTSVRRGLLLDGTFGWELRTRRKMGYGIFKHPVTLLDNTGIQPGLNTANQPNDWH